MISIIICSRNSDIPLQLKENIRETIGIEYEIITIDNSKNEFAISSAYNAGIAKSKFPFLCFIHDDVLFKTKNWGEKIVKQLNDSNTGLIGVAGGKVMTKVPASWSVEGRYLNIIQKYPQKKAEHLKEPNNFTGIKQQVILLDGFFLAARKDFFSEKIRFDESLIGYHGYDYDISMQSVNAGYHNWVIYDVLLEHFSSGNKNMFYLKNLMQVHRKWENTLPVFTEDMSTEIRKNIHSIEAKRLAKLIRRLSQRGFDDREIIQTVDYYVDLLQTKEAKKQKRFLFLKINFERIFHSKKN